MDSLDKRIGRLSGVGALVQINNNNPNSKLKLMSDEELHELAHWEKQKMLTEKGELEFVDASTD